MNYIRIDLGEVYGLSTYIVIEIGQLTVMTLHPKMRGKKDN